MAEVIAAHRHKEPHERKNGPWHDWELSDAAHHLDKASKISGNKKFLEAIKKHSEHRAKEHHHMAQQAELLAKSGRISPKALEKVKA